MGTASKITGTLATAINKVSGVAISGIANIMGQVISLFSANATALDFDGTNDLVNCGNDSSIKPAILTYNAWVYRTSWTDNKVNPYDTIMGTFKAASGIYMRWKSKRIQVWARLYKEGTGGANRSVQTAYNQFRPGKPYYRSSGWHMITATFDGRYLRLYIDGAPEISGGTPVYDCGSTGWVVDYDSGSSYTWNLDIGKQVSTGHFFDGTIDEVAVWNVALDADAIAELWDQNGGTVGPSNLNVDKDNYDNSGDLQGWWRFEEGSGTVVSDSSTNSNTGTLSGASWWTSNIPS